MNVFRPICPPANLYKHFGQHAIVENTDQNNSVRQ